MGQFLNFDRPAMKWYNISPQPHSIVAPKVQDGFKNIVSGLFNTTMPISTPVRQFGQWETVNRENINVLNHIFWFNTASAKATEEMEKQLGIIKAAKDDTEFEDAMECVKQCVSLQSSVH